MPSVIDEFIVRAHEGLLTTSDVGWSEPRAYAPARRLTLLLAEARLGFRLPRLLRALYLKVGNGGFGPGYGLFGLTGGHALYHGCRHRHLVQVYHAFLRTPHPFAPWQDRLLPICTWGSAYFSYLDCAEPRAPVMSFDLNSPGHGPWGCAFALHAPSLESWLRRFLDGEDLWESFGAEGEPDFDVAPAAPD